MEVPSANSASAARIVRYLLIRGSRNFVNVRDRHSSELQCEAREQRLLVRSVRSRDGTALERCDVVVQGPLVVLVEIPIGAAAPCARLAGRALGVGEGIRATDESCIVDVELVVTRHELPGAPCLVLERKDRAGSKAAELLVLAGREPCELHVPRRVIEGV